MARRDDQRRSSLSTLFEVRAYKPIVFAVLFAAAAALTWALSK